MKLTYLIVVLFIIAGCQVEVNLDLSELEDPLEELWNPGLAPFYHGVASGDPTQDAVIIWTKLTPSDSIPEAKGTWEVSSGEDFSSITKSGEYTTGPERNYTVKVDVTELEAGATYYYRFGYEGKYSITGRTKTAPTQIEELTLGVVSCSNYEAGFFNAYDALAKNEDVDVVLHLGDYIYEYGVGSYGDSSTGRFHKPVHEIISLEGYRTRYAQYRLDENLRAAHQAHPFITIWDDHEIANDSYKDGAQNHQEDEGDYGVRSSYARQAYYEWLPVRESDKLYRSFSYGNMAQLIMLDERLEGRTQQVDSLTDPNIKNPERGMIGQEQMSWFQNELKSNEANWNIIGNQVIFSYLNWGFPGFSINLDSWDGYPGEQAAIIEFIMANALDNVVFVTGDTHSSWGLEVTNDPFGTYQAEGAVAIELGTPSINSSNSNERAPTEAVLEHELKIVKDSLNPQLKYTNLRDHGYMTLTLSENEGKATWYYMESILEPNTNVASTKEMSFTRGEQRLQE
ncbi:MAG: alkaline phosphatase D family protein [Bacteroidota bacterium]